MKKYIKPLKTLLPFNQITGYTYHLVIISLFFIILITSFNWWLLIIFLAYTIYLLITVSHLKLIIAILLILILTTTIINNCHSPFYPDDYYLIITSTTTTDNQYQYLIEKTHPHNQLFYRIFKTKYLWYSDEQYLPGDILVISGYLTTVSGSHYPNGFDYQRKLALDKTYGIINSSYHQKYHNRFIIGKIRYIITTYYQKHLDPQSSGFLLGLLFGQKDYLDDQLINNTQEIGISHLFVVSGMHVSFILLIFSKLFNLLKIRKRFYLELIIIISYGIALTFTIAIIRVLLSYLLNHLKWRNSNEIDKLSLNILIVIIINPLIIYKLSFILSYTISSGLIIGSRLLNKIKNPIIKTISYSGYIMIISFPIILSFNPQFNLLSMLFNLIYIPIILYILLPLTIFNAIFYQFDYIYLIIIKQFINLTNLTTKLNFLTISFSQINFLEAMGYYLLIYLIGYCWYYQYYKNLLKLSIGLIGLLIVIITPRSFDHLDQIQFIDLARGEATLITGKFNRYNILIDTGDHESKDKYEITKYLQNQGIKSLDYVFITHSDSDHIGGLYNIIKYLKVKNIIFNRYQDQQTINYFNNLGINCYLLKAGDQINYKGLSFNIISPSINFNNINENSLVMVVDFNGFKGLFCGDIERLAEEYIVNQSIRYQVDFIKIAHHGSKTSSSIEFLNLIDYQMAIICNGYSNRFEFPHQQTLDRLSNYLITSQKTTIIYQRNLFNKRYHLKI